MFCKSCGKSTGGLSLCEKCAWELENKETTAILERLEENISFYRESAETHEDEGHRIIAEFILRVLERIKTGRAITEKDLESGVK